MCIYVKKIYGAFLRYDGISWYHCSSMILIWIESHVFDDILIREYHFMRKRQQSHTGMVALIVGCGVNL